ncbi:MAG: TatD family hydrolase [Deltaproteobacteria bacterium]|jgi:TatD DNase family protein|nr:TatD family hydrolase [Deltaproteobacteria bacterium]
MASSPPSLVSPWPIIDAHCHLFLPELSGDLPAIIFRAQEAGLEAIVNMGLDARTNQEAFDLAAQYPLLKATCGWHPHGADKCQKSDLLELEKMAQRPDNLALGEIGLDFYYLHSPQKIQEDLFHELLSLASQTRLPVVIHTREAFESTLAILKAHRASLGRILIHCFTGSWLEAKAYMDLDCYFSIPGVVTFPKALELRAALRQMPKDRLLLETDAPYLAPAPRRGRRNEPAYLSYTLAGLAGALELDQERTAFLTTQNARNFFGLAEEE